jgi:hypothetical protein
MVFVCLPVDRAAVEAVLNLSAQELVESEHLGGKSRASTGMDPIRRPQRTYPFPGRAPGFRPATCGTFSSPFTSRIEIYKKTSASIFRRLRNVAPLVSGSAEAIFCLAPSLAVINVTTIW